MGPVDPWTQGPIYFCVVCGEPGGTRHHLIPRAARVARRGGEDPVVRLCRKCHDDVHYYFSLYELATHYNSEELLKAELLIRKDMHLQELKWKENNTADQPQPPRDQNREH